jgi:phosphohistidine phosphatase
MKYLNLIRHAKSSWETPDLDDIARPLNARGKEAISIIGNYLVQQKIKPDLIISSPAVRAAETANGIASIVLYDVKKIQTEAVVYFGTSSVIIEHLQNLAPQYNDVFLFGHEPILSSMIFQFTKKSLDKFPTCSVCRIAFNTNHWKEIKTGNCEFLISPKQLIK